MKPLRLSLTCALLIVLTACNTYKVSEITSYQKDRKTIWRHGGLGTEMINPYRYTLPGETNSLYKQARDFNNPTNAMEARNSLQGILIELSDRAVSQHLSRVTGTQINVNLVAGSAALAATGVAAVGSPNLAKAAATAGVGILGFKSLFAEEVYKNALVQSLVGAIVTDREKLKSDIRTSQRMSISDYSADMAIEDARTLHEHGSFYYGLTLIRQDVEAANQARLTNASQSNALDRATNNQSKIKALNALRTGH